MSLLRLISISIALVIIGATGVYFWQHRAEIPTKAEVQTILEHTREIITPPPLRGPLDQAAGNLTQAGVLVETNRQRQQNNVAALQAHAALNTAAQAKLSDMFSQQYFEHVGPDGKGPADWVEGVGYEYIKVGENLALGNFASDAALVQAWMDSPGHRANILNEDFTEIGIAVGRGNFEGRSTWLAVQTFAQPLSACPTPNRTLQTQVETTEATLRTQETTLSSLQATIDQAESALEKQLAEIERLLALAREKIAEGNAQITAGNRIYQQTGSREQAQPYWDSGAQLHEEGAALQAQARQFQEEYNEQVAQLQQQQTEYNQRVTTFNSLRETMKRDVATLNQQIRTFNRCAQN